MKNKFQSSIYIIIVSLFILFIGTRSVFASSVVISPSKDYIGIDEQFYVDVSVDPEGSLINGVEGSIKYDENILSLVRVEDGKSMVNLWVEKPTKISGGIVKFSGVMTSGFDGVIDPFNSKKLPGIIARFVFKGIKGGETNIESLPLNITLNDGLGTIITTEKINKKIIIQNTINHFVYESNTDVNPELDFKIIQDPNLYNNKYVLIFQAKDKETGIDKVLIKEGNREWEKVESPYLLKDQSRHSRIALQAINYSGASISVNIDGLPYDWSKIILLGIVLLIILIAFIILIKKYVFKK